MEHAWNWPKRGKNQLGSLVRFGWGSSGPGLYQDGGQVAGGEVCLIGKVRMGQRHTQLASQAYFGGAERRHQSVDSTSGKSERETPPQCPAGEEAVFTELFSVRVYSWYHDPCPRVCFLTGKDSLAYWVWPCRDPVSTSPEISSTDALIPLPLGLHTLLQYSQMPPKEHSTWAWGFLPSGHICITKHDPSQSNT